MMLRLRLFFAVGFLSLAVTARSGKVNYASESCHVGDSQCGTGNYMSLIQQDFTVLKNAGEELVQLFTSQSRSAPAASAVVEKEKKMAAIQQAPAAAEKEAAAGAEKKEGAEKTEAAAGAAAGAEAKDTAAATEEKKGAAAETETKVEYAKIAPFGKEDTATELQEHASRTQDTLVDAVENAEVAEIKRAVFRALTRLRAASIKEFDTIARLETQSIDEYNDAHHYRTENPLAYLHDDEPGVGEDKYTSFH